jgi:hypothetical protein
MPFPSNLDAMFAAGYDYLRWEKCAECGEMVEVYSTPGKREIVMEPMVGRHSPAIRHFERCNIAPHSEAQGGSASAGVPKPSPEPQKPAVPSPAPDIRMYGVRDPNHQLLAVGWATGILVCRWAKGEGEHTGVPEDLYLKLRRVPFAYSQYQKTIKGKFPYRKVE